MTLRKIYPLSLLVFFATNICACPDSAIPYEDIADALQASKAVYDNKLSVNSLVPYTSYHIKKVYLFDNELDEPCIDGVLKVIIAERAFTTIVAMKGPNGPTSVKPELFKYLQIFKGTEVIFAGNHTAIDICFWKSFKLMLPSIRGQLQDQARKYIITGHSTGGALASILALYMKVQEGRMWENSGTCLITFGQPRVGDELFAKLHDAMIDPFRKLRFINDKDPIPHVPIWKTAVHHSRNLVTYDDVHDALQASKIVYDKSVALKLPIPYTKFKIKQLYQIESDDDSIEDGIKVLVAEKDDEFTTLVAIKGPNGPDALKWNVYQKLQRFDGVKVKFKSNETLVNAYFWKAFELVKNNIAPKMQDQSRKYILTGHSIGGAIASILALYLKAHEGRMWENPESCLITFGQPRVGDIRYAMLHDKLIDPFRKFRFVNDLDPAPHIPFWPEAVHHSREIWMTSAIMSKEKYWKICGVMEPLRGSNMWVQNPQVNDHDIKAYRDFIVHPPTVYLDTFYGRHNKWIDALENSCSGNTTKNSSNDDLIPKSL